MLKEFNSLPELERAIPTEEAAILHLRNVRWPSGVVCVHCGGVEKIYDLKQGRFKCGDCKGRFTVRHDTIFADTKLELRLWFKAIFLMTSMKKGVASHRLAELLGITQKSAWHMLHRVRNATMTSEFRRVQQMSGTVQLDETLLGGKEHWKHASKRRGSAAIGRGSSYTKTAVFGMLSSSGELRMKSVRNVGKAALMPIIIRNIRGGSVVHTDESTSYKWMENHYEHGLVKHRFGQYVSPEGIHTNGIEGVFSHFKRSIVGVYHKASDAHVDRYLAMFSWRWTRREMGAGEKVNDLLKSTKGRRLTYKALTRKLAS